MKPNFQSMLSFLLLVIFTALVAPLASAATRTAYFNQSGQNKTVNGLANGGTSSCRVTISNPSGQEQKFELSASVNSIDSWGSGTQPCASASAETSGTVSGGSISCSGTSAEVVLASSASVTYTFLYNAYPARSTVQAGTQKLRCSGSILAKDSSQPGFLVASGVLVTFVESTKMTTDGVTSGGSPTAATFGGMAVYTQVPITINRGKPF